MEKRKLLNERSSLPKIVNMNAFYISPAPEYLACTMQVGTNRVLVNNYLSTIDYFLEQEKLKKSGIPY